MTPVLDCASPSKTTPQPNLRRVAAIPIAIVGAGPYGLSLAAHLRAKDIPFRIFGRSMYMWRHQMPSEMHLKSEPFASSLYEPSGRFSLRHYCKERGLAFKEVGVPVSRSVFCDYAMAFQDRFVPDLEEYNVAAIRRGYEDGSSVFELQLEDGSVLQAVNVVLAVGITHYSYLPDSLQSIPAELRSHSSTIGDADHLLTGKVAVIGGGSSAIDCAIMLASRGLETHLLTRREALAFHSAPQHRSLIKRLRWPMSTVGPGWRGVMCTRFPDVFRALPAPLRIKITQRFLGPAPCWFTREPFERAVSLHTGVRNLTATKTATQNVSLHFTSSDDHRSLEVDHVVAATGYKADLNRLNFVEPSLLASIAREGDTPVLSSSFESSIPGLFFTGVSASNAFGPMLRFACGAGFAARRITRRFSRYSTTCRNAIEAARISPT